MEYMGKMVTCKNLTAEVPVVTPADQRLAKQGLFETNACEYIQPDDPEEALWEVKKIINEHRSAHKPPHIKYEVTWKGKEWNGMTQWIARGQLIKTAPEVVKAWEAKGKRKGTKRKAPAGASSQGRRPRRAPPPTPPRRNPPRQAAAPAVESTGTDEEESEDSGDEAAQGGQLDACDLLGI